MAVQMLRKTTMRSVEMRNHSCQPSLSILVMIRTPTNKVAITERAAISLVKQVFLRGYISTNLRLRLKRWP